MHHDHLGTSVRVNSHSHHSFPEFQARASVLIIVDNLNPILLNNFIEWLVWQHLSSFKQGIIVFVISLLNLIEIMKLQLFGELEPDLILVVLSLGFNIWHL